MTERFDPLEFLKEGEQRSFVSDIILWKDGETKRIRFTQEIKDGYAFMRHFTDNQSKTCTAHDYGACEECANGSIPQKRIAINALELDSDGNVLKHGFVVQGPKNFYTPLYVLSQQNQNKLITDKDYFVIRQGKGFNTMYIFNPQNPQPRAFPPNKDAEARFGSGGISSSENQEVSVDESNLDSLIGF